MKVSLSTELAIVIGVGIFFYSLYLYLIGTMIGRWKSDIFYKKNRRFN